MGFHVLLRPKMTSGTVREHSEHRMHRFRTIPGSVAFAWVAIHIMEAVGAGATTVSQTH